MAQPVVSDSAQEVYDGLVPVFTDGDESRGWTTLYLVDALVTSGGIEQVHFFVVDRDDGTPGWGIAMDPDEAPAAVLPWLSQFSGAVITPSMTEDQARDAIKSPEGLRRGTIEAIERVAKRRLTGTQTVMVDERWHGSAWQLRIRTLASETPYPELTEADIRAEQKPIGIVLTYKAIENQDWGDVTAKYASWAELKANNATWLELRTDLPSDP